MFPGLEYGRTRLIATEKNARLDWLRGMDLNHRPLGYEPNELPDCSTPQSDFSSTPPVRQTSVLYNAG